MYSYGSLCFHFAANAIVSTAASSRATCSIVKPCLRRKYLSSNSVLVLSCGYRQTGRALGVVIQHAAARDGHDRLADAVVARRRRLRRCLVASVMSVVSLLLDLLQFDEVRGIVDVDGDEVAVVAAERAVFGETPLTRLLSHLPPDRRSTSRWARACGTSSPRGAKCR